MVFFHPDGHALFLLALCIIGPLTLFGLIALITGAKDLGRAAAVDAKRSGLSWDDDTADQLETSGERREAMVQAPESAAAQLETANDTHPRHATSGG